MAISEDRFSFGRNWRNFVEKNFSAERVANAKTRLLQLLRLDNLNGYTFLDIGCGSGLHSLAALQSGASRVVSLDYDRDAVETTRYLRSLEGNPDHWEIKQGSVLDDIFMRFLPPADIIYTWGVLHHTGDTWKALANARIPLSANGVLFVALYSYTSYYNAYLACGNPTPEQWLEIKKQYNRAGILGKRIMEGQYSSQMFLWRDLHHFLSELKSPSKAMQRIRDFSRTVSSYKKNRGMEFWTDVRDWLGGWPMDFLKESEVVQFAEARLGLELLDMITGEGNTEFVFRPIGAQNYWDEVLKQYTVEELPRPYNHNQGYCWSALLPNLVDLADREEMPTCSDLRIFEDGKQLSFAHAPRITIQKSGAGRYSHWHDKLYFSTSDNSNPNDNGRHYTIRYLPSGKPRYSS
jgi:2-polyprenyl-3-methyl-5-hydroxy-6-metoxy-1,4-benzoquinol methylase